LLRQRREAHDGVSEEFHQDAARSAGDDRAELRVVGHAGDHLHAGRRHPLHGEGVGRRAAGGEVGGHFPGCGADRLSSAQMQSHRAHLRFVEDLRADRLERQLAAERFRRLPCLVRRRGEPLFDAREAVAGEQRLGLVGREPAAATAQRFRDHCRVRIGLPSTTARAAAATAAAIMSTGVDLGGARSPGRVFRLRRSPSPAPGRRTGSPAGRRRPRRHRRSTRSSGG
jgi:hypothetical protein